MQTDNKLPMAALAALTEILANENDLAAFSTRRMKHQDGLTRLELCGFIEWTGRDDVYSLTLDGRELGKQLTSAWLKLTGAYGGI